MALHRLCVPVLLLAHHLRWRGGVSKMDGMRVPLFLLVVCAFSSVSNAALAQVAEEETPTPAATDAETTDAAAAEGAEGDGEVAPPEYEEPQAAPLANT
ncbi:MAG: hypothetical protein JRH11_28330, partial [Deltaproteobacteria bacterium]|nr:hypothetical protein [Deltaproteobacteria bacterium]